MFRFHCWLLLSLFCSVATSVLEAVSCAAEDPLPNVVVIFIDDMGYADIGPFGATGYATPHLDRMAAEGRKFTDFHSATAVCSAARAALLTGCYPERISLLGALGPKARHGIAQEELTLAELFKQKDYATACFGKWHLGHHWEFLPLQHGFDEFYGLPYSNDMWPLHPAYADLPADSEKRKRGFPDLPLLEGNDIVKPKVTGADQSQLTTQYTEKAVEFIKAHKGEPFFLYVPHTMVHVPLFVSEKFKGRSGAGLFGDVVMELDWSVGEILSALKSEGIDDKTLVIFTSDNGPWLSYGNHAGSAAPLREGKGTMFEGGYREPCLMRWPGKIPAGTVCDELSTTMDLLPTCARLLNVELPPERRLDGKDIGPLIAGEEGARSPHQIFYCYYNNELRAVRDRRWKLHLPHSYRTLSDGRRGSGGKPVPYAQGKIGRALFDLRSDVGETVNVAKEHTDVVARLEQYAEQARLTLGDKLTGRIGSQVRPAGVLRQSN